MNVFQVSLAVLAAALLGALGWMTDWGQGLGEIELGDKAVVAKTEGATVLPDFKLSSDTNTYALIAEKPLLNPTRKPAPTQPIVAVAPEPPKPQIRRGLYQLVGVSDFGGVKVAQVKEVAGGKVRSVKLGEALQELTVKTIDRDRLTLEFQGETDVLEVARFTASGRVPQPPAPPPVPIAAARPALAPGAMPPAVTTQPNAIREPTPPVAPPTAIAAQPAAAPPAEASQDSLEARRARRAALTDPARQPPSGARSSFGPSSRN
jgi:hypothetical protein